MTTTTTTTTTTRPVDDGRAHRLQRIAGRAGVGFLLANLPLMALGVLADWQTPLDLPADAGDTADTFATHGTAVSGPLPPVVITGALGLLAHRDDRLGTGATALLAVIGSLIVFNGARQAVVDPSTTATPEGVLIAGGLVFVALGLTIAGTAFRALAARVRGR